MHQIISSCAYICLNRHDPLEIRVSASSRFKMSVIGEAVPSPCADPVPTPKLIEHALHDTTSNIRAGVVVPAPNAGAVALCRITWSSTCCEAFLAHRRGCHIWS